MWYWFCFYYIHTDTFIILPLISDLSQTKFFTAFWGSVWSENKGGGTPGPLPWIGHWSILPARVANQKTRLAHLARLAFRAGAIYGRFFGRAKHETGVELEIRAVGEGAEKRTSVHTPLFVPFNFIFSAPSAIARVSRSSLALRFPSFALETSLIKKGWQSEECYSSCWMSVLLSIDIFRYHHTLPIAR